KRIHHRHGLLLAVLLCGSGMLAGAQQAAEEEAGGTGAVATGEAVALEAASPAVDPAGNPEASTGSAEAAQAPAPATTTVILATTMGEIHIALEVERAPVTAANFLRYVDAKRFDGMTFYRAHKVSEDGRYAIVQGGLQGDSKKVYKAIAHESPQQTGLSHVDGAISMARENPGTARSEEHTSEL